MAYYAHNPKTKECYRIARYPNFVRVTNASGETKNYSNFDFHFWYFQNELVKGLPETCYAAYNALEAAFGRLYGVPDADQLRKQLARKLGGEILDAPHWNGVGRGHFDTKRPGAIIIHIGTSVKGIGRYATAARFWPDNVLEAFEAMEKS